MTQAHERTATLSQLVGKQIKLKLFLADMSGRDLAGKLGVSPSWVSYRLSGKQEIGLDDLFRIANALDVELPELLTPEILARAAEAPRSTHVHPGGGQPNGGLADLNLSRPPADRSAQPRRARLIGDHPIGRPGTPPAEGRRRPRGSRPANRPMAA